MCEHGHDDHQECMSFCIEAEALAKPLSLHFNLGVLVEQYESCGVLPTSTRGGAFSVAV